MNDELKWNITFYWCCNRLAISPAPGELSYAHQPSVFPHTPHTFILPTTLTNFFFFNFQLKLLRLMWHSQHLIWMKRIDYAMLCLNTMRCDSITIQLCCVIKIETLCIILIENRYFPSAFSLIKHSMQIMVHEWNTKYKQISKFFRSIRFKEISNILTKWLTFWLATLWLYMIILWKLLKK